METAEPMRTALKRLAADNLANLNPHPLYAWFYYSHPPLVERIERLRIDSPSLIEKGCLPLPLAKGGWEGFCEMRNEYLKKGEKNGYQDF